MKKRDPGRIFVNDKLQALIDKDLCPICLTPRSEWKRKLKSYCCSPECTKKFRSDPDGWTFGWTHMRAKIVERDNHKCVKCGRAEVIDRSVSNLTVDHIMPIALGGEEYDPENLQTLCPECNKIKTAEDLKVINRERYKEIHGDYKLTHEEYIAKHYHKIEDFS